MTDNTIPINKFGWRTNKLKHRFNYIFFSCAPYFQNPFQNFSTRPVSNNPCYRIIGFSTSQEDGASNIPRQVTMIFNRKARHAAIALETAQTILEPLHAILPGVANRVVQSLSGGQTLELGGQALLQGLTAWRDSSVEKEVQSALGRQEQRLNDFRSRETQQNKTILDLQNKIKHLEQDKEKQNLEKEFLQKTIQDQNSIIANQHERLIALLGHARS
jgi:hypothetical protein